MGGPVFIVVVVVGEKGLSTRVISEELKQLRSLSSGTLDWSVNVMSAHY